MAKPIKSLELHYPMIQFLITINKGSLEIRNTWSWCSQTWFAILFINENEKKKVLTVTVLISLYLTYFCRSSPDLSIWGLKFKDKKKQKYAVVEVTFSFYLRFRWVSVPLRSILQN